MSKRRQRIDNEQAIDVMMQSNCSSKNSSVSQSSSIAPQEFRVSHHSNDTDFGQQDEEDNSSVIDSLKGSMSEPKKARVDAKNNGGDVSVKKLWVQCRVCRANRNTFFCSDCIRKGDFTPSKQRVPERFAEKKLKHFRLKSEQTVISDKIEALLNNGFVKDELVFNLCF